MMMLLMLLIKGLIYWGLTWLLDGYFSREVSGFIGEYHC